MSRFYEYELPPLGYLEGDEKIVVEKNGVTYSSPTSYISLANLGDVDASTATDKDVLIWNNGTGKFETGVTGVSGTFTAQSGETITVTNGIVTSIV